MITSEKKNFPNSFRIMFLPTLTPDYGTSIVLSNSVQKPRPLEFKAPGSGGNEWMRNEMDDTKMKRDREPTFLLREADAATPVDLRHRSHEF
jgi:hypothetical protein